MPLPEVWKLINLIKPRLIFPMHYKTSAVAYKLTELDVFLKDATNVVKHPTFSIEVDSALLAENRTIVMNWKH
jgi:L-ascorbate metabolism protein UlaG (beta-lactamase superfamily)